MKYKSGTIIKAGNYTYLVIGLTPYQQYRLYRLHSCTHIRTEFKYCITIESWFDDMIKLYPNAIIYRAP